VTDHFVVFGARAAFGQGMQVFDVGLAGLQGFPVGEIRDGMFADCSSPVRGEIFVEPDRDDFPAPSGAT
jgi:hypothetical protein